MSIWPPVATLLPHGPTARCIDEIVEFDSGLHVVAALRVRPDLVVYDNVRNGIPAWAATEIMAQAAGLYLGLAAGPAARGVGGYLLRVRNFRTRCQTFTTDTKLLVEAVSRGVDSSGTGRFQCRILIGGKEMVSAQLTFGGSRGHCGPIGPD